MVVSRERELAVFAIVSVMNVSKGSIQAIAGDVAKGTKCQVCTTSELLETNATAISAATSKASDVAKNSPMHSPIFGLRRTSLGAEIVSHERSEPECRTRAVNYYDGYGDLVEKKKDTIWLD
jgi:hypothetical protein